MADNKIQVSLHGFSEATGKGFNKDGDLISGGRIIAQRRMDKIVRFSDDFLGDVLADQWNVVEGTDSSTSDAVVTNDIAGTLVMTTGDSATVTMAGNGIQVTHGAFYNWKAANGGLRFEARLKVSAITNIYLFVGFTDLGTLEAPIESAGSADTITTNATDAVGFMFDTRMSTDNIWLVGVKGDTDATKQDTSQALVADTYITLGLEVNSSGAADFYINGAKVGSRMSDALTTTVGLTPTIAAASITTATRTVTVDYVDVAMHRV
jgi:hypothetical protein